MLAIHRFILSIILLIVAIFYAVFAYFYTTDQQQKTDLIVENLRQDLSETAYILSSEMQGLESLERFRSLLNRKVANTPFISALTITYGNRLVLSTETQIKVPPSDTLPLKKGLPVTNAQLLNNPIFEKQVRFYIQDQPAHFSLMLYTDQRAIQRYFAENHTDFWLLFGLIPLLTLIASWFIMRTLLTQPLEILRQFAYYQSAPPKHFLIRELEYIRASMTQTFARLEHEKKELYRLARTDDLSGLANRNQLNERLTWLIAESARTKTEFALLFLDLDNFKTINDSLGHEVGDTLLQNIAGLIQQVLRQYDIIARVGGDEFVIVINHYQTTLELSHIITRILESISELHIIDTHPIFISASVGVAFYPKDGIDSSSLMKNADIAMYEAKNSGKNQFKFFTEALHQQILLEIELDHSMRLAHKEAQFLLYYQPKIDVTTGLVNGAEALIRWKHPTKGLISPAEFIPAAEKNGLMVELGQWILQEAMAQQVRWQQAGLVDLKMSINLSAVQFLDNHFDQKFQNLFTQSGIHPSKLDLEMTESVLMSNSERNLNSLKKIRGLGAAISLDDFGTGYSSLAYLKKFPINTLKIDKSFMDDYNTTSGAIFIETIVKIAQTLHLDVVAEGVEHPEQLAYLQKIGCQSYQGYLASPPLTAQAFENYIKAHNKC